MKKITEKDFKPLEQPEGIKGMTTPLIRGLINHLAKDIDLYVEIGSYQGSTLIAAADGNPSTLCIGIDNFVEFDKLRQNEQILRKATKPFSNIEFWNKDGYVALKELAQKDGVDVGCFFYDGNHTYADTLKALEMMDESLAKDGTMIIDDTNMGNDDWSDEIGQSVLDFCKSHNYEVIFERTSAKNGSSDYWNGIMVIARKAKKGMTTKKAKEVIKSKGPKIPADRDILLTEK